MTKPGNNYRGNPQGRKSTEEHQRAQAELMWNDRLAGLTNKAIAEKYNVGLRTVTNRFEKFPKEGYDRSVKTVANTGNTFALNPELISETEKMWNDKVNEGLSLRDLAERYGVGVETVKRRLQGFFPEKSMIALEKHRLREDDKLDMLEERAMQLLNKKHYVVDKGHVIMHPETGEPLEDSAPQFQAINTMLKVIEAKRKMFGLDAPVRAEVTHNTGVEIQIQDVSDAVAEAHRRNEEKKLRLLAERTKEITDGDDEIPDAEVVDDGSAPTEGES